MTLADHTQSPSYTPAVWRVIPLHHADGPTNMAIDEAIADAVRAGEVPPTLRFYGWEPPCLSLGFSQPASDADTGALQQYGWGIVRRLTGGRAILHIDELTYSVAIPEQDPRVEGGVVESYRRLSRGLMQGLESLGVAVHSEAAEQGARGFKGAVCFEVPSDYELTANGKKLVGSAQTRRSGIVLQHGALPLHGDIARICDALTFPDQAACQAARVRVAERAITLHEAFGMRLSAERVADALQAGFSAALNLSFEPGELTPAEKERAAEIRAARYAAQEWTEKL